MNLGLSTTLAYKLTTTNKLTNQKKKFNHAYSKGNLDLDNSNWLIVHRRYNADSDHKLISQVRARLV